MSDPGTVTYNYPVIQECVDKMKRFADNVEAHAGDLENRTRALMAGHWVGDSADQYDQHATRMKNALDEIESAVTQLHGTVSSGAEQLQEADKAGAK